MGRPVVDGVLLEWGTPLFYPHAKAGQKTPGDKLPLPGGGRITAAAIRGRIKATVCRTPQAIVKIARGGRGMGAIRQHLRYITRQGELKLTDEQGREHHGLDELGDVAQAWRWAGTTIPQVSHRREALHLTLDAGPGVGEHDLVTAAQEFAQREFGGHRYVWVFHGDQSKPHLHLAVRVEGHNLQRLDPRKADLQRWRESVAQSLRGRGIEVEATRRVTRGVLREAEPIWTARARQAGTLSHEPHAPDYTRIKEGAMHEALTAWGHIHNALQASPDPADQQLARDIKAFLGTTSMVQHLASRALAQETQRRQRQDQAQRQSQHGDLRHGNAISRSRR